MQSSCPNRKPHTVELALELAPPLPPLDQSFDDLYYPGPGFGLNAERIARDMDAALEGGLCPSSRCQRANDLAFFGGGIIQRKDVAAGAKIVGTRSEIGATC